MTIRGPLITPAARRKTPQQPQVLANLLATTLAPAGAVQRPFNRTEWPNPIRPPVSMSRHFLVTTSFFESAVPQIKFDFHNPIIKRKVQQPVVLPNLVLNTLYVTPPIPKVRQEFQNPIIARRVRQPDVWQRIPSYLVFSGSDSTPDAFGFTDQSGVATSSTITSAAVTITGIDAPAAIEVSGDASSLYIVNGGAPTADPGTVENGDEVQLQHTSSASYLTATNTVVTIGGVSDTFTSITEGDPANAAYIYRPYSFNWWRS